MRLFGDMRGWCDLLEAGTQWASSPRRYDGSFGVRRAWRIVLTMLEGSSPHCLSGTPSRWLYGVGIGGRSLPASLVAVHHVSFWARSLLRMDGPSVAERSRAGCKEQRSAEYWRYSSERRRRRRPGEGAAKPRGQEAGRGGPSARRASARHATPGGYAQQAPSRLEGARDRDGRSGDVQCHVRGAHTG